MFHSKVQIITQTPLKIITCEGICYGFVIIFLPLPKSLLSGNTKAKNEKRNHSERLQRTMQLHDV